MAYHGIDEMQEALMRSQFRRMFHDIGLDQSMVVLQEIIITAAILSEILSEETEASNEKKGN